MRTIKLTAETFESEVLRSEIPVLVDFAAEWCAPCKMMSPILDELSEELTGKIKVAKIDVDGAQELAAAYGVMSIPNIILFKDGGVVTQMVGAMAKDKLLKQIAAHLR